MHYERKGISWKASPDDEMPQTLASYRCDFDGCSVRFDNLNGYLTVVLTPQRPYFIEEPVVNLLQSPEHYTWLYRSESHDDTSRYNWHCRVEGMRLRPFTEN
jgi:hypothetical protein